MSGLQWFVAVDGLKGPATEAAVDGRITFWPERWRKAYVSWLDGLRDWNISRQLWWGHRIPAWYCAGRSRHGVARGSRRVCDLRLRGDRAGPRRPRHVVLVAALAVLDARLARRDAGARGLLSERGARDRLRDPLPLGRADDHVGDVARRRHPVPRRGDPRTGARRARAEDVEVARQRDRPASRSSISTAPTRSGSRSRGSRPAGSRTSRSRWTRSRAGRNFANKIWNAARLVLEALPGGEPQLPPDERLTAPQRWLLSRHERCVAEVNAALDRYEFAAARAGACTGSSGRSTATGVSRWRRSGSGPMTPPSPTTPRTSSPGSWSGRSGSCTR